jgi:CheY-like chemotaxis protein
MKRILWIEDEGLKLLTYKTDLVKAGYDIDIAEDATEAIEMIKESKYDALIFDLIIPHGINFCSEEFYIGFALLKAIIKNEVEINNEYNSKQMMVFTAVKNDDIHQKIRNLGVDTILNKAPSDPEDLKLAVDKLIAESES